MRVTTREIGNDATDLLHDTRLALRECDVATRLVGDELDLNLSSLTSGLIIVIIVVVGGCWPLAFDAATVGIAVSDGVVVEGGRRAFIVIGDVGHCEFVLRFPFEV